MSTAVISTKDLTYSYSKNTKTLNSIDLQVERGSVYGFLGPNGSGKTTTLSLLLGLLPIQQGQIELFGQALHSNRIAVLQRTGSLIESPSLYGHLTAVENLRLYQKIYRAPVQRIEEVLKLVGLEDTAEKPVRRFSLGMKQRLGIALALLPSPELLILDEPTNGLDPNGIIDLRKLIKKLNKVFGVTILVSSHLLAEVEKMVSHVGIISEGRLLFQGTLPELQQLQKKQARLKIKTSDNEAAYRILHDFSPERSREEILVSYQCSTEVAQINRLLTLHNVDVYVLQPAEHTLEQLFIELTTR